MPKWKWLLVFGLFSVVTLGQVIKVDVRMVEVYVSVTDSKGKPVTNLQSSDFRLSGGRPAAGSSRLRVRFCRNDSRVVDRYDRERSA